MMTKLRKALLCCTASIILLAVQTGFPAAQNKLIARKFDWHVAQTDHFDVYYYPGSEAWLPHVSEYLETSYSRVTKGLGIEIPDRSPFFLFLNHNEFEQNNIVDVGEGTGGVTEAFKNRFLVFNDGTLSVAGTCGGSRVHAWRSSMFSIPVFGNLQDC